DAFRRAARRPVRVRLAGRSADGAVLQSVGVRASTLLPHPALGADLGGPLAVKHLPHAGETPKVHLAAPRLEATVELSPELSRRLHAGQIGYVALGERESIGRRLTRWLGDWIDLRLGRRH